MKILKAHSSLLLVFFCTITLWGCATTAIYQPHSKDTEWLGYQDFKVNDSTYRVKFWGSENNSEESVNNAAMYRVAEFTQEQGYDYFVILDDMKSFVKRGEHMGSNDIAATNPGWGQPHPEENRSHGLPAFGNSTGSNTTNPGMTETMTVQITGPVRTKTFAMGKGAVPDGAVSAKAVLDEYASKIKRPTN